MIGKVTAFVKKNTVAVIAFAAALLTSFIVKPDTKYISYFDFRTLTCLFCVLAVVCALKNRDGSFLRGYRERGGHHRRPDAGAEQNLIMRRAFHAH